AALAGGGSAAGSCTVAQARAAFRSTTAAALVAVSIPRARPDAAVVAKVNASGKYAYSGPDRRICFDFTGDGVSDLAVSIASGGTAGDTSWAVFAGKAGGGWRPVLARLDVYKVY